MATTHLDPLTCHDSEQKATLGAEYDWGGKTVMYVKNAGADDAVAGKAALRKSGGADGEMSYTPATCVKGTINNAHPVAGVWLYPVAAGKFGFILRKGRYASASVASSVAIGDPLYCGGGATPNFTGTKITAATHESGIYAFAQSAESSNLADIQVDARG